MQFTNAEIAAWVVNFVLILAVLVRIHQLGIGSQHRYFRLFLIVNALSTGLMLFTTYVLGKKYVNFYGFQYVAKSHYLSVFQFLFVLEIISQTLKPYPAVEKASRTTLQAFWGVIVVIGVSWYFYLIQLPSQKFSPELLAAFRYQDAVCIGFTLFLVLTLGFFTWMPVPMTSNARNHALLSTLYFAAVALSRFSAEFPGEANIRLVISSIGIAGSIVQLVGWLLLIHPPDDQFTTMRGPVDREEANRLLARMEKLNETLSRSA